MWCYSLPAGTGQLGRGVVGRRFEWRHTIPSVRLPAMQTSRPLIAARTVLCGIATVTLATGTPSVRLDAAVSPHTRHAAAADVRTAAPEVRRVRFLGGVDTLVWKPVPGIAVSSNGHVAVASDVAIGRNEGLILQIISPSSSAMMSIARRGQGPGELSGDDIPFATGDTFHSSSNCDAIPTSGTPTPGSFLVRRGYRPELIWYSPFTAIRWMCNPFLPIRGRRNWFQCVAELVN